MPVYEYDCKACGHVSESLRPMRDADAPIACESCGSKRTKRAHSVFDRNTHNIVSFKSDHRPEFST